MGAAKLLIDHKRGQRRLRQLTVGERREPMIIGSSRSAHIHLFGEGVSPIHAMLENRNGEWFISDLGSTTGTWVSGESVVERKLSGPATIQIGPHQLAVKFVRPPRELFTKDAKAPTQLELHQVVIKRNGKVIETHLLPKTKSFTYHDGRTDVELRAPNSNEWVKSDLGKSSVFQRLVPAQEKAQSASFQIGDMEIRRPMAGGLAALILISLAVVLWPKKPSEPLNLAQPSYENQFEQMIYDAKLVAKKREETTKIVKEKLKKAPISAEGGTGGGGTGGTPGGGSQQGQKNSGGVATQGTGQGAKLITSIRASGLNQLIGKIAKRSTKNVMQIGAGGAAVTPDQVASGSGLAAMMGTKTQANASVDKVAGIAGVHSETQGNGFRLGGVHTNGKGGGGTAYGSGVGLAMGGVGKGTGTGNGKGTGYGNGSGSGVESLDDETEVSGGLDKEAIAEVIRRDIGQIRYCYERQLSANKDLYGKVVIKFTIGSEGLVESQKVGSSTLNNAMVEGCILRRAAKWKFPTPKGVSSVMVSYPFLFKSLN